MCDFRGPPKAIRDRVTGTEVETPYRGHIYRESMPYVDAPGIYGFVATGSYYQYYDGNRWFYEHQTLKDKEGKVYWERSGVDFIHGETHELNCSGFREDKNIYEIKNDPNGYKMVLVVGKK